MPPAEKQPQIAEVQTYFMFVQRKYPEVVRVAESTDDQLLADNKRCLWVKYTPMGLAKKRLSDEPGARNALLKAKSVGEDAIKEPSGAQDAKWHVRLAEALALLGEKEAAIAEVTRATDLLPESKDAFEGTDVAETSARVYMEIGEIDRSIDILDHLLAVPSNMTVSLLKVQPFWNPIRQHPRFIELLKRHGGT